MRNLSQAYKNAYWDEIPDYAKDPDGRWSAAYWGAIAFTVNTDIVTNVPNPGRIFSNLNTKTPSA